MLDVYRSRSTREPGFLQPLANACWRASAFEWQLYEDSAAIRGLWEEGARALAEGFVRKRIRPEQAPEQLLLAMHLALASRSFELVRRLTQLTLHHQRTKPGRSRLFLIEAHLAIARAVFEEGSESPETIERLLDEARAELDTHVQPSQFVSNREAFWKADEHVFVCSLLKLVASLLASGEIDLSIESRFASTMDTALERVSQFVEGETNHRPKFYFWLPGVALTILAEVAGLSLEWLHERHREKIPHYTRLPLKLI
jgi:hypothetical protein